MKTQDLVRLIGLTVCVLVLAACSSPAPAAPPALTVVNVQTPVPPTQPPAPPPTAPSAAMANPASVFCQQQGGKTDIRKDAKGGEAGYCVFPDKTECEEWAFQRGECKPGAKPTAAASTPLSLAAKDNGKTFDVALNGIVEVVLEGNPGSTGYLWGLEAGNDAVLKPAGDYKFTSTSNALGAGGKFSFKFQAISAGTATLKFANKRPWELNDPKAETFTVTIKVGGAASSGGAQLKLTKADNGKTIALALGGMVQIELDENSASTGYTWQEVSNNAAVLKPAGDQTTKPAGALPGTPGKLTLQYQAVGAGTTTLRLGYKQWWDAAMKPDPTFEVTVNVGGATVLGAAPASADPFAYCATAGNLDAPDARWTGPKVPDAVLTGIVKALKLAPDMPKDLLTQSTSWRCMNNKVYACTVGANLPCQEKADTNKTPSAALNDFCKANPSSTVVPAVVTGRATVYEWKCASGKPEVVKQLFTADARGFIADFWYEISK